jgi:hypothetical protein
MRLDIEFADGHVRAAAEGPSATADKPQSPAASKPRGRRGNDNSNQGSLFGA